MTIKKPLVALALLLAVSPASGASRDFDTETVKLSAEIVAEGLEHPWGLALLPNGEALVTERPGRIRILTNSGLSEPVKGVPKVLARGEGGLLDIAIAQDFANSGIIFFSYVEPGNGGVSTAVARAKLVREGANPRLEDVKVIFAVAPKSKTSVHFGSRIVVNDDGTLFLTTGDLGQRNRSQDMHDAAGAVVRINADGSAPADNPSPDGEKMASEIWSKGHRILRWP